MKDIAYFDNAATTFPKPPEVVGEVVRCMEEYCGNPGRGSHRMALKAAEKIYETRLLAAEMFSCPMPDGVVFTQNATYALNMAIMGLVKRESHVLISDLEHNSVVRPLEHLRKNEGVTFSVFSTSGNVTENIRRKLRGNTTAIICTHRSNITNRSLPLERIGRLAGQRGILFIVDGSQSAGTQRIDMDRCKISALCVPGHKGLLAPQGVGMAVFSPDVLPSPFVFGGSGSLSREFDMPGVLPDRLEGGTLPTPAVAGLCEGMKYVLKRGMYDIYQRECEIMKKVKQYFAAKPEIVSYSEGEGAVWLFNVRGMSSQQLSRRLDEFGVCTRPGLHCAPLAHKTLGTPEDGAVRASAGPLTTEKDADILICALEKVLKQSRYQN
ncbi:MAG: aminotransferase class V-fold PLP-dependent enzyme [Clostridia bacterium]|nr:aminotransferase class V-fold PLP-dependent enzyme [Clostridia bacterium]